MKVKNINELKKYMGKTLYQATENGVNKDSVNGYGEDEWGMFLMTNYQNVYLDDIVDEMPSELTYGSYSTGYSYVQNRTFKRGLANYMHKRLQKRVAELNRESLIRQGKELLNRAGVKYEILDDASNEKKKTKRRKKKATKNDK